MELSNRDYSLMTSEDIEFEFEPFLEKHEENLPQGLDAQYMAYVPILEDPFRNIHRLPKAFRNLPMNAVLHQSWKSLFSIYAIFLIISLPSFIFMIVTSSLVDAEVLIGFDKSDQEIFGIRTKTGLGVSFVLFIILGVTASFIYLKYIYGSLNNLIESRKAPWLVEKINKQFNSTYQRAWSRRLLVISFLLPFLPEIPMVIIALSNMGTNLNIGVIIFWLIFALSGHVGFSLLIFVALVSFQYIRLNTKIYDQVLQTIIDRVKGYTEGQESILNKKNYEVVGVLSDTPGLSVRTLGDIPVFGLGSGIFTINSLIFLLFSPFLLEGPIANYLRLNRGTINDPFGMSLIIIIGVLISSIVSFGAVIAPLIRITRVMGRFKNKALTELDPFIFDEITGVALRKDTDISNETQVLFMIRQYIYSMKVSPVNPFRLVQIVALAILYSWRGLPVIFMIIGLIGSIVGG